MRQATGRVSYLETALGKTLDAIHRPHSVANSGSKISRQAAA
jgi:hypothetical protein